MPIKILDGILIKNLEKYDNSLVTNLLNNHATQFASSTYY